MTLEDWRALVRSHLPTRTARRDPDIVDELAWHLADLYAEALADGHSQEEAAAIARAALPSDRDRLARDVAAATQTLPGAFSDTLNRSIDAPSRTRRWSFMNGFSRDLLVAARTLWRSRGFAAIALLTLTLGIGATSAIFAAVDTVLLRPMPYRNADRLVVPVSIHTGRGIDRASISFADYTDWRNEKDVFDAVSLWRPTTVDLSGEEGPERAQAAQVSEEYFRVIDAVPQAGRVFTPADHQERAPLVTVLSHGLWQRRFGARADIVGRTVRVAGAPAEVVGVLPPRSVWPTSALFLPLRTGTFSQDMRTRRDNLIFFAFARLREDVPLERGQAAVETIAARIERDHPEARKGWTNALLPLREFVVEPELRRALVVLFAAVGAVLLIGCANLANLVLVRGLGRARETGVRLALGASRWRIVQQQLAESTVLAAAGAVLGAALAGWMIQGLAAMAPPGTPFIDDLGLNRRVLLGAGLIAAATLAISGLLPALAGSSVRLAPALKDGTPGAGSSRRTVLVRQGLIVLEVAIAVTLLVSASLLIRSFANVLRINPGVDVDRVLSARMALPGARYPTADYSAAFITRLTDRLAAAPGVAAAGATSYVPVGGGGFGLGRVFLAEGWPEPPAGPDVGAQWNVVTPDYFRTMGIAVRRGRVFDARDQMKTTPVIVVSETFAKRMFGDADPIGRRTRSWRDENVLREIVGVVADVRYAGLTDDRLSLIYVPHSQDSWRLMNVVVRASSGPPEAMAAILRREVAAIDPDLALANVETLETIASNSVARERYTTLLLSLLAATALALGAIGIYGVISHAVSLRRHELGVRIALGASRRHLYGLVFRQGLGLMGLGLAIGLAGAYAASKGLRALLFETTPTDAVAYGVAVATIAVALALACLGPARRAANADPVGVLRDPG